MLYTKNSNSRLSTDVKQFYVYVFLDPRKPGTFKYLELGQTFKYEPFYVGKGSNQRWKVHIMEAKSSKTYCRPNMRKLAKIRHILAENLLPEVIFIGKSLSNFKACKLEIKAIAAIKRIEDKGPLTNLCIGGERGCFGKKHTDDARRKMSANHYNCSGINNSMFGKNHTSEAKRKMSLAKKGNTGIKNRNAKQFILISPAGEVIKVVGNILRLCKEKNLVYSALLKSFKSDKPCFTGNTKGWRCTSIQNFHPTK